MPNYILLLRDNPDQFAGVSPAEMEAIIGRYVAWRESVEAKGHTISGEKLQDGTGRVLRPGVAGAADGPYAEAKEVVGGFFMISAADYDQAVALARTCPHADFGSIEVRQVEPTE